MIEPLVVHCDGPGCTATRRETNHWWILNLGATKEMFKPFLGGSVRVFYAMPWAAARDSEIRAGKHACSHSCAQKIFEAWMAEMDKQPAEASA